MSTSVDRMGRLLALVPWLRSRSGVTIETAAAHFNISAEQLERDLWLLVVCGIPGYGPDELIDIDFWDDGHIHVRDPLTLDQPMRLSGDEVAALSIALDALAQLPAAAPEVISARDKLIRATAEWQDLAVEVGDVSGTEVMERIGTAIQEHRSLDLTYASGTTGLIEERHVIPRSVSTIDGRAVLDAYCLRAHGQRTFRLDRILQAHVGAPMSVPEPDATVEIEPTYAECVVHPDAQWIVDVHPVEVLDTATDGTWTVRIAVHDPRWLVRLVLGLGGALEVRSPLTLRQAVAEEARASLTAYASHQP